MSNLRNKLKGIYQRLPVIRELTSLRNYASAQTDLVNQQLRLQLLAQEKYSDPKKLNRFEFRAYSQNHEDGIIEEIFKRIGTTTKYFVEFGIEHGLETNCTFLLTQHWHGVMFEGNAEYVDHARRNLHPAIHDARLTIVQSFVTAENIGSLMESAGVPAEFDFLSLDIDRNTYFAWQALEKYRPRVACIEYNGQFGPSAEWTVDYVADRSWNGTMYGGASLKSLQLLGERLGYNLVGCDLHGINAFFVRSDLVGDHFCEPFTSENHFEPLRIAMTPYFSHARAFSDA